MMKRVKKITTFSILSLALIFSGCSEEKPTVIEPEKTNEIDPPGEEIPPEYCGDESGHYKIDSNGNRASELEPHQLVHYNGDPQHIDREPTCENPGVRYDVCSICGKIVTVEIPKLDHEFGDWTVTKEATATEEGIRQRSCSKCGYAETETFKLEVPPVDQYPTENYYDGYYVCIWFILR